MLRPNELVLPVQVAPSSPLHWSKFWPDLIRVHRQKSEERQRLIIWLANLHAAAINSGKPRAFCEVSVRLMDLREMVRDYHVALDHFFEIKRAGFYIDEDTFEVSTLIPRRLPRAEKLVVNDIVSRVRYCPPLRPLDGTISKVIVRQHLDRTALKDRLTKDGRGDLFPAVEWLLNQPCAELNFYFKPSGKLQLRDTSIWPICGIETWPSWLREELFGRSVDLDAAYIQFLLQRVSQAYADREHLVSLLFPDIVRLLHDKENFRRELCTKVFNKSYTERNKAVIKQIIMSLANGSRISGDVLLGGGSHSLTAQLILGFIPDATRSELMAIGNRLKGISSQFSAAKKAACLAQAKAPNRLNMKGVFRDYFTWEREARYALWNACDRHGIMVHDGLDGIPHAYVSRLPEIMRELNLKLTA